MWGLVDILSDDLGAVDDSVQKRHVVKGSSREEALSPTLEMTDLDHGVAVQVEREGQSLGVL